MSQALTSENVDAAVDFGDGATLSTPHGPLPLFVELTDAALRTDIAAFSRWLADHRDALEKVLLDNGAVVFRGAPVREADDFAKVIEPFPAHSQSYAGGGAVRSPIKGRVMQSTRIDPKINLPMHQEMAYLARNPRVVAFFSRVVAETGGATTIADMRKVTDNLPADLLAKFDRRGVIYTRNLLSPDTTDERTNPLFGHSNWVANFGTEDRAEVEAACAERGMTPEWLPDGSLNMHNRLHGTIVHPVTGKLLYFNQAHAMIQRRHAYGDEAFAALERIYGDTHPRGYNSTFGDGSAITDDELTAIYDAIASETIVFQWEPGDVMFVENKLVAHGRAPFTGAREVQVALID